MVNPNSSCTEMSRAKAVQPPFLEAALEICKCLRSTGGECNYNNSNSFDNSSPARATPRKHLRLQHHPRHGGLPIYQRELARLWDILEEADVVVKKGNTFMHGPASSVNIESGIRSAKELSEELMAAFPQFASAHGLADLLGPYLAECLTGQADPIAMLFGSDASRTLLEDFYANGPDLRAAT